MDHISKWTEFHRLRPNWFPSLWYVRRKPCTYLQSRLVLSRNKPKQAFIWASSPRGSIRCVQNDFLGYGMFGANCGSILHRVEHYLQTDRNEILHDPHHLGVPSYASKMISESTVRLAQTMHLSWIKISTILKRSEMSFHLTLITQEYHLVHQKQFLSLWYV
jgi:hypothetical protein